MERAHQYISEHSRKQHQHLVRFAELDAAREAAIDRAVERCRAGEPFTVDEINEATRRIIEHAKHGISPTRVFVTEEMVREYVQRNSAE